MKKAKWIWPFGEFEIYHHMHLSMRRREFGCDYPSIWYVCRPELAAKFQTEFTAEDDFTLHVYSTGGGRIVINDTPFPVDSDIRLKKGKYTLTAEIYSFDSFPAIFADSEYVKTDTDWTTLLYGIGQAPTAAEPEFTSADSSPANFPFEYTPLVKVAEEKINGGVLFDFGRESFGEITLENTDDCGEITIVFGESRAEALDFENATVRDRLSGEFDKKRPACAFRYVFVSSESGKLPTVSAAEQTVFAKQKGSFSCDDETVNAVYGLCVRTLELNHREFYLDGIKRDRWVWSGDAYQSCGIDRYIFFDDGIVKRTITALLGRPPFRTHINTINDYSAYMPIAVWEYYFSTADSKFVSDIFPRLRELFDFIVSRTDENGYVVRRPSDWIFIDWGTLDKTDPVCAEQILLCAAAEAMAKLGAAIGEHDDFSGIAEALRIKINADFWDEDRGGYIDSFTSGKHFTSRQTNVLAVLFGIADKEKRGKILKNILLNDTLPEITTPYFKFFELCALAELGEIRRVQDYIISYWGGMLQRNATSIWEQYIPGESDTEALAMYGKKFNRSLCHAWGAGPILLLGKYIAGVRPTAPGFAEYEVTPQPGRFNRFDCTVPTPFGAIRVTCDNGKISVFEEHNKT